MNFTIGGIIIDVMILILIIGNASMGYRKGLVRVAFKLLSSIIAFILVMILYKPTTNFIMNNTSIPNSIETTIAEKVEILFQNGATQAVQQMPEENSMMSMLKVFIGNDIGNVVEQATTDIVQTVTHEITYKIISTVVFFALFAVVRLILYVLRGYMEWIADLPILDVINATGGMIYGVVRGFFIVYIGLAIVSLFMPIFGDTVILSAIESALIGSKMFNNNILLNVIFKFL